MYLNPYDLLGVDYRSSLCELRDRYKNLALIMHPDKGGNKDDMIKLHQAYLYIREQLEYANHDKTYEKLEEEFEQFCKNQEKVEVPDLLNIIHNEDFKEKFNEKFEREKEEGNCYKLSYSRGYEKEIQSEKKIEKALMIYEEPIASKYSGYCEQMYLGKEDDMEDFTNYNDERGFGSDFIQAYGEGDDQYEKYDEMSEDKKDVINLNNFEKELEKIMKERNSFDNNIKEKKINLGFTPMKI